MAKTFRAWEIDRVWMLPPTVRELVPDGHVALDGTKVKANASKHKVLSYGRMKQAEPRLEAGVSGWLEDAERIDTEEDALEEEAKMEAEKKRAQRPDDDDRPRVGRPLWTTPKDKAQRNSTDPESRIMKGADGYVQA